MLVISRRNKVRIEESPSDFYSMYFRIHFRFLKIPVWSFGCVLKSSQDGGIDEGIIGDRTVRV